MRISTKDSAGRPNGYLQLLWNALEHDWRPDQVYATTVLVATRKGPHRHEKRIGRFFCVSGKALFRLRTIVDGKTYYEDFEMCPDRHIPLIVEPGTACAIYNWIGEPAVVINMPSPAWSKEDPDDHPVTEWEDPDGWEGYVSL